MAVIFYEEGEHPAGFIGFRVATTLGDAKDFSQAYFGLTEYSYDQAHSLAHELNEKWRSTAKQVVRQRRLSETSSRKRPGYIAVGLRATILIEQHPQSSEPSIRPCFVVQKPGYGKGQIVYPIIKHGYLKAYILAVDHYAQLNNLSEQETASLICRPPDKRIFTENLWRHLIDRDIFVSKKAIQLKLDQSPQ